MKKIYFLATIILLTSCGSVTKLEKPADFQKSLILETNHNSNYIKANEWMVNTFNDPKSIIQFSDKDAGIVKGKYVMYSGQAATKYTAEVKPYFSIITIRVKDKASKIEISPISEFVITNFMGSKAGFTPEMFSLSAKSLAEKFEKHMKDKSANDNW
ncbi:MULTISPECIES: DUF4468 domain-containing protein [Tenacibaculum]|uniref:DUF4468 domain-containing protein n=1 Tax=Tenacibaculum TaxID=104267 RepID=UPI001F0B5C03|nr:MULTISPECIES: DUF4468 domain-containing protein [Tenacibaculum]MCH3883264.1 DUF4468 domain-containing protein [Tenacibaculum aquimarinum]MDO6600380.1 DUF4468 domain-containing protein [Tenacibaculum sp. 1_MG-2023]